MWKYAFYVFTLVLLISVMVFEHLNSKKNKNLPKETKISEWDDNTVHTETEL